MNPTRSTPPRRPQAPTFQPSRRDRCPRPTWRRTTCPTWAWIRRRRSPTQTTCSSSGAPSTRCRSRDCRNILLTSHSCCYNNCFGVRADTQHLMHFSRSYPAPGRSVWSINLRGFWRVWRSDTFLFDAGPSAFSTAHSLSRFPTTFSPPASSRPRCGVFLPPLRNTSMAAPKSGLYIFGIRVGGTTLAGGEARF